MTSTDHGAAAVRPWRLPFALGPVIARAKRVARQHPVLIAAALVGAGGAAVTLTSSSAFQPAAACRGWKGYYAYAVPQDPAHAPAPGAGATSWGWTPRKYPVKVADRINVNGHLWQVTKIAAMPGVEPMCRPFGIIGWNGSGSMVLGGRLVLRRVG